MKTSTDSAEHEKKKNQTWKLIYLPLRAGVTGLQSSSAPGRFLLFSLFFLGYAFTSVEAEPPFEGILPVEHRVVDFFESFLLHILGSPSPLIYDTFHGAFKSAVAF